jgi:hypothetical protein
MPPTPTQATLSFAFGDADWARRGHTENAAPATATVLRNDRRVMGLFIAPLSFLRRAACPPIPREYHASLAMSESASARVGSAGIAQADDNPLRPLAEDAPGALGQVVRAGDPPPFFAADLDDVGQGQGVPNLQVSIT